MVQNRLRQAEFLERRVPLLSAPDASPSSKPRMLSSNFGSSVDRAPAALFGEENRVVTTINELRIMTFEFDPLQLS